MDTQSILDTVKTGNPFPGSSMTVEQQLNGKYQIVSIDNHPIMSAEHIKQSPYVYKNVDEEGVQFFQKTLQVETVVRTGSALDNFVKNHTSGKGKSKNVF